MSAPTPHDPIEPAVDDGNLSRLGRRDLQALAKANGINAKDTSANLIKELERVKAMHGSLKQPGDDAESQPETPGPADDADDPLGLDDEDDADEPAQGDAEAPAAGEAASAPAAGQDPAAEPTEGSTAGALAASGVDTAPRRRRGAPDLTQQHGPVITDGRGAQAFRVAWPWPHHDDPTDAYHFTFIADTHGVAQAAGYQTKGGATVGERLGYGVDADGKRVVIYQVAVKRGGPVVG